jgi:cation:H+ antiporter
MVWLQFCISIIIIFYCGRKLSYYGDVISKKTGLGGGFIGVILLGAVTSLPELITTVSSVSLVKQVDLAWGNILGSNLLNLTILCFCDVFIKKNNEIRIFDRGNVLTGNLSVIITLISLIAIATGKDLIFFHHVSVYTVLILSVYVTGSFLLYKSAVADKNDSGIEPEQTDIENAKLFLIFGVNAALIIVSGISVTYACDEIAKITGLGATFVGTLFLAIATSLPEIVVSASAIKIGAVSMAGGNILGSNFFNISILGFSDIFYTSGSGSIYLDASKINLFTGIMFVIVTNIVLGGMILRSDKRFFKFGFDSIVVIILYILTFYYIYEAI